MFPYYKAQQGIISWTRHPISFLMLGSAVSSSTPNDFQVDGLTGN